MVMVVVVSLVVAMEIEMVLMVLLSVVVVGMLLILLVVVVHTYTYIHTSFNGADCSSGGMMLIILVVAVVAKCGGWGISGEFKGGAAGADGVWKSYAVSDSFLDAPAAYGCGSDFHRGSRAACGGKR